jgi:alpha-tubulin suppressor-like RCC1 family protein
MACALRADGTVWCWGLVPGWGYYSIGEPRQVPGLANATAIAVGATSTCALIAGQAWCFGWNYDGSLGVPPTDSHDLRTEPVRVPLPAPLVAIAAGSGLACALGAAGEVWCWGNINRTGVRFTDEIAREAAEVRGPTRIAVPAARAIAAGHDAGCAIAREGGALVCWGELAARGSFGGATRYLAPTAIAGIADATAIAISGLAFCALQRASPPTCWGTGPAMDDRLAQIEALRADGKLPAVRPHVNAARLAPYYDAVGVRNEAVASARAVLATDPDPRALHGHAELAGASALAVGELHACAVVDAEVRCWGANYAGRLGDGTRTDSRLRAVDVAELPPVTQLAIGELESCALTAAGALWCWGHEELPN